MRSLGLGVVLQVVGELRQHRVEGQPRPVGRVGADLGEPGDQLGGDPAGHRVVEARRRPPRRPLLQHLGDRVRVLEQPPVQLVEGQVDDALVHAVAHHLGQQPAGQRRDRLLAEPRDQRLGDQVGDVLVAHLAQPDRGDLRDLVDDPAYVRGVGQPGSDALARSPPTRRVRG